MLRYYHHVFDPHATLAGNVNAGLNGDHHSRHQLFFLSLGHARRLMDLKAHAVPG